MEQKRKVLVPRPAKDANPIRNRKALTANGEAYYYVIYWLPADEQKWDVGRWVPLRHQVVTDHFRKFELLDEHGYVKNLSAFDRWQRFLRAMWHLQFDVPIELQRDFSLELSQEVLGEEDVPVDMDFDEEEVVQGARPTEAIPAAKAGYTRQPGVRQTTRRNVDTQVKQVYSQQPSNTLWIFLVFFLILGGIAFVWQGMLPWLAIGAVIAAIAVAIFALFRVGGTRLPKGIMIIGLVGVIAIGVHATWDGPLHWVRFVGKTSLPHSGLVDQYTGHGDSPSAPSEFVAFTMPTQKRDGYYCLILKVPHGGQIDQTHASQVIIGPQIRNGEFSQYTSCDVTFAGSGENLLMTIKVNTDPPYQVIFQQQKDGTWKKLGP